MQRKDLRILLLQIRDDANVRKEELESFAKYSELDVAQIDVLNVFDKSNEIIANIKKTRSPFFLEIETSRWMEHVGPNTDFHLGYRNQEEIDRFKEKDSLIDLSTKLDKDDINKTTTIYIIVAYLDRKDDFACLKYIKY